MRSALLPRPRVGLQRSVAPSRRPAVAQCCFGPRNLSLGSKCPYRVLGLTPDESVDDESIKVLASCHGQFGRGAAGRAPSVSWPLVKGVSPLIGMLSRGSTEAAGRRQAGLRVSSVEAAFSGAFALPR